MSVPNFRSVGPRVQLAAWSANRQTHRRTLSESRGPSTYIEVTARTIVATISSLIENSANISLRHNGKRLYRPDTLASTIGASTESRQTLPKVLPLLLAQEVKIYWVPFSFNIRNV